MINTDKYLFQISPQKYLSIFIMHFFCMQFLCSYIFVSTKFNIEALPTFVIVSPEGVVIDKMRGYAEDAVKNLVNTNVRP